MSTSTIPQAQIRELADSNPKKPRPLSQESGYMSALSGRISSDGSSHVESLSYPDLATFINQIIDESIMELEAEASPPSPKAPDQLLKFTSHPPQSADVISILAADVLTSPFRVISDEQTDILPHPQIGERKSSKQHSFQEKAAHIGHIALESAEVLGSVCNIIGDTTSTVETVVKTVTNTTEHLEHVEHILTNISLGQDLGFEGVEGLISIATIALEGSRAIGALKDRRIEDLKDHSSQILHASLMGSAAGLETYNAIQEVLTHGWSHLAAAGEAGEHIAMHIAPHFLTVAGFALYGTIQGVGMKRIYKPLKALEEALTSEFPIGMRHAEALQKFAEQFYVTETLSEKITNKHPQTAKGVIAISKEITKELKLRYKKLEKRVGKKVAEKIYTKLMATYYLLEVATKHPEDAALKEQVDQAFKELPALLQQYKNGLTKQMVIKSARLFGAVLGITAATIGAATPIGAAVLSGVAVAYLLYVLYQDKKVDADTFAKTSILAQKLFGFEVSPAKNKSPVIEEIDDATNATDPEVDQHFDPEVDAHFPAGMTLIRSYT